LVSFGLTQIYRQSLFKQIHEICFHGKGGYDWETVYNMPIWLRNFTFNEMKNHYEEEAAKSSGKKGDSWTNPNSETAMAAKDGTKVKVPDFVGKKPSYNTTIKNKALKN
jgi:hypothetical protein